MTEIENPLTNSTITSNREWYLKFD